MEKNSEKFCLKWTNFQENINTVFGELRNDQEFSDVTLACEDGTVVEAHKVILASSSPFFKEILQRSKHPHPLIYMRGVKAETLTATVDFLYSGEANVCQENLDAFLAFAEELRLKGLTGLAENNHPKYDAEEPRQKDIAPGKQRKESIGNMPAAPMDIHRPHIEEEFPSEMQVAMLFSDEVLDDVLLDGDDVRQLEEQVKSMMDFSDKMTNHGNQKGRGRICKVCGKEGNMSNIMTHIESKHITSNISHSCDICGKINRLRFT